MPLFGNTITGMPPSTESTPAPPKSASAPISPPRARALKTAGARLDLGSVDLQAQGPLATPHEPQTLEEVLNYMHRCHVLFLGEYHVGDGLQRRLRGQGFVQFVEHRRDGAQFAIKVRLPRHACNGSRAMSPGRRVRRREPVPAPAGCGTVQLDSPVTFTTSDWPDALRSRQTQLQTARALQFFDDAGAFEKEMALHSGGKLHGVLLPAVQSSANARGAVRGPFDFVFPAFTITERGESLREWMARSAPDLATAVFVLLHVCRCVQRLHAAGVCHRDLRATNVLWRPSTRTWALVDFAESCPTGVLPGRPVSSPLRATRQPIMQIILLRVDRLHTDYVQVPQHH